MAGSIRTGDQKAAKLGFRSSFVLAKLGFDLREQFKDAVDQPFPEDIERMIGRLRGPGGRIARLEDRRPR